MSQQIDIAELIKEKADVVETIGRIVPLKKVGRSWSGLCPFHTETDGSFHVYEDGGYFICFGCGAKGDIISFYQRYYRLGFVEACERLCAEYGIDWQPGGSMKADKSLDALYEANRFAGAEYYAAMKAEGNPALEYMLGRGIDRRTISKFRLGYADGSARMLASKLESDERLAKAAEEVGLVYRYSGRLRDRYAERVMFPIVNTKGKVIGFGGRDLSGTAKAKYINSAGSKVFSKGLNLFGLNITGTAIREQGFALLVEGYMDLVALYMHGVTNVAAQLGTAFTKEQAKLLGRYSKNVVLALDSDESGLKAAEKSMDILAAEGIKVRVLVIEGAKDPDEYIRTYGRESFDTAVAAAAPMVDFKLRRLKLTFDLTASDGLVDFLKAAARVIAPLSPVEQDLYTRRLSGETGISEEAIRLQAGVSGATGPGLDHWNGPPGAGRQASGAAPEMTVWTSLLRDALALALTSNEMLDRAVEYRHFFEGTDFGPVFSAMIQVHERTGDLPGTDALSELLSEADQPVLEDALRAVKPDATPGAVSEYLYRFEIEDLKLREQKIKDSEAFAEGDTDLTNEYMAIRGRIIQLQETIRKGEVHW
ncbi:MAG: DNA primase [Clostridiales Family XIII bacterium]|nr:DNA primase [Clostridiales Family XIII bacterium]